MLPPPTLAAVATAPELIRLGGTVGYALAASEPLRPVADGLDLGAGSYAVTLAASQAQLNFADGTRIAIGERAALAIVGDDGNRTTVQLVRGALHVVVKPTSVIAILTPTGGVALSNADAFIVVGPRGTQIACVRCADTTVLAGPTEHRRLGTCTLGDATAGDLIVRTPPDVDNPAFDALTGGDDALAPCTRVRATRVDRTGSNPGARDVLAKGWGTFTAGAVFAILTMVGARAG
ncbi:MAG: FecR domain-containing protein [Vulcanimicrobiaceae bacterium]|jgi:hypothetical protein